METDPNTPSLHRMSYSELKKLAKKHGIKGNMKAGKLIAALSSVSVDSSDNESFSTPTQKQFNSSKKNKEQHFNEDKVTPLVTPRRGRSLMQMSEGEKNVASLSSVDSSDLECFSTPAQKQINSSRKNKELNFDVDSETPLPTPRRGTYSVGSPESVKVEDISSASVAVDSSLLDMSSVTVSRGSERKKVQDISSASAAIDSSLLDMSNVTVSRGSERKLRPRKVSFMSPMRTPTPKNPSIKLRPKTPIASRVSLGKRVSFSTPPRDQKKKSLDKPLRKTPLPKHSFHKENSDQSFSSDVPETGLATPLPTITEAAVKETSTVFVKLSQNAGSVEPKVTKVETSKSNQIATQGSAKPQGRNNLMSAKVKHMVTPGSAKSIGSQSQTSAKIKRIATPSSAKSIGAQSQTSAKIKRIATPNFKKIHEKAFEKMESIDDYQKRKLIDSAKKFDLRPNLRSKVTKAKSKIPAFSGIPFIPSFLSSEIRKVAEDKKVTKAGVSVDTQKMKAVKENASMKSKAKFDLKASLSRKLGYKPYTGRLKPLMESNNLNTPSVACFHKVKEPTKERNKVVGANRLQARSVLRGVRTNKRFELQMKNRNLE